MHIEELRKQLCYIISSEYATLNSWLPATNTVVSAPVDTAVPLGETCETGDSESERQLSKRHHCPVTRVTSGSTCELCPPCIRGQVASSWQHDQLVLRSSLPECVLETDISKISDPLLADYLCQGRAIIPYSRNEDDAFLVECLTQLRK